MSMRGNIHIDQLPLPVEVTQQGQQILVKIANQEILVSLYETEEGFQARVADVMLNLDLPKQQRDELRLAHPTSVAVDGKLHHVHFTPQRAQRTAKASKSSNGDAKGGIAAFMPGTIVRVIAEQGQAVKEGDVLLILEAMKMENEVKAPHDGILAQMNVQAGANVNKGQILAVVQPPSSP